MIISEMKFEGDEKVK